MLHAETVTFGGGGLMRAAHLRSDESALKALWEQGGQVLLVWHGKPLMQRSHAEAPSDQLMWLESSHELVAGQFNQSVFLGLAEGGAGLFAVELKDWTPAEFDQSSLGSFVDRTEQQHPDLPDIACFAELRQVMVALSPLEAEVASTAKAVLAWHSSHGFCAKCGTASDLIEAGWQRKCSNCGASHFPRTDPVVIMLITQGDRVLVGRSPEWPEGMYSLLAGFVEPGETIEAAVRREVWEEAGVKVGAVSYLASQPWAFPMSLMFGCAGKALSEEITIDPNEIEDALWVSKSDMMQAFAGDHPKIKPARKGAIARFLIDNWLSDTLD
ncbi:NAD(+) diphosphatase [Epibacterium ulvae]|uniref:NAD(+) diphosphatase n=1 Tax=Epibacterium ulvae TaxID=1156985 RepID=UPI0024926324|nr:NAD(+) diphosphatase [Epibacterium ulvae]